ncbi:hypothetical protein AXA65_08850 [Chryseobacterium sp. FP211-J200]|nr:hypothetical protein AXA65_08850 [Chryseobacterium sp. FP211-J200]
MQTCKNCGHRFEGKFCNNCGQTADTNRINYHDLKHQLTHSLFHIDAGLLYTSKQLFIRPGHAYQRISGWETGESYQTAVLHPDIGGILHSGLPLARY